MKGDFTRETHDPGKHFSRVLMQQGRVQLDADWNEQTAILLHYLRTLARDIFGPHAGPAGYLGFEVITRRTDNLDDRLAAIEPDAQRRRSLRDAVTRHGNLVIGPGRYYVDGLLVENERAVLYTEQLGYPFDDATRLDALQGWQRGLLLYLDVWERHITHVEDGYIREAALGGPDTCSRAQVVWQLKVLLQRSRAVPFSCEAVEELPALGTGQLRARARPDKAPAGSCGTPSKPRYRGAENRLYRVEVHKGGLGGAHDEGATFKWSRENGSIVFPIRSLSGTKVVLEHLGRDHRSSLKPGDWVEVVDDAIALGQNAGPLARVDAVNRDDMSATLTVPTGAPGLPEYDRSGAEAKHALLRRWDHNAESSLGGAVPIVESENSQHGWSDGWIDLEDGIQVWFAEGGSYRTGDYWLVPARTSTGDVEWPDELDASGRPKLDVDGHPIPASQAPRGPRHCYAPISLLNPGRQNAEDCRRAIKPLQCESNRQSRA